ncbi:MMPL family transporter [Rothia halotolerans]|uniref:MMPL family transporter n=1 Tax=Rothia halotolerans TaxID=405770 RepID=UPI00101CE964|nr:MMPL family transporter [Rothia halotolerans]
MASLLYRLGRFAARTSWLFIALWVVVLAAAGGSFAAFGGQLSSSFSIPGSETERLQDVLEDELPSASNGIGQVVLSTDDDQPFTEDQRAEISDFLGTLSDVDGVEQAIDPFQSEETVAESKTQLDDAARQIEGGWSQLGSAEDQLQQGRDQLESARAEADGAAGQRLDEQQRELDSTADQLESSREELSSQQESYNRSLALFELSSASDMVSDDDTTALVNISFSESEQNISQETKDAVMDAFDDAGLTGVDVDFSMTITQDINSLAGPAEIIGVVVALVVLLVMLGTLIAAGLPILTALIGVGIGSLITLALSAVFEVQQITPILGLMLGLAVGIDYSLFIINRHRTNLRHGMEIRESIGLANGTSGNAVVFAGSTVMIALLALNVVGIPFLGLMGTTAAMCVLIAVLISVTLTPALLGLVGQRVLSKGQRAAYRGDAGKHVRRRNLTEARGWIKMVTRNPVVVIVATVVVLGVIAIPAASMRLGLPDASTEPEDSTQYQAYQTIADKFGAGANGPIVGVAQTDEDLDEEQAQDLQIDIAQRILEDDDVVSVLPSGMSDDRSTLVFQITPQDGPAADSTEDLVNNLRDLSDETEDRFGASLGVTGMTGGNIDISQILAKALPVYVGIVLGLSFIVMVLVFRSILVPLFATLGFLFSLLAVFGGVVAIYQWGWLGPVFQVHDPSVVLSFLPILTVGILFGLAMDYQIFLVTGMRESYAHGQPARRAVVSGYNQSARVVIAAAIIMMSVFGGFIFSELTMIRPIGFGLALGVFLDAFIIRMTLIPAVMHLLGEKAWWIPRWLDRILPNVDVEGSSLENRVHGGHDSEEAEKASETSRETPAEAR